MLGFNKNEMILMMRALAFLFLTILTICIFIFFTGVYSEKLGINVFGMFKLKFKNKEKRLLTTGIVNKSTPKS